MAFQPQHTSRNGRINTHLFPPVRFIATAVDLAMMATTQGDRELIADKSQMMGVRRAATADQTRLLGDQSNVLPIANSSRRRQRKHAFVYRNGSPSLFGPILTPKP